ncbi:MAG TPA: Xaa-Pro peptidase family protein [Vicinamibacterales bacterium]|nr:Xaa-Pro peptidase family protein [Vicinamibacterales bacterium]
MSHAPSAALRRRHDAVRAACERAGVDGLIVTARSNILYLTNFTGSAAIAVVTPDRLHFITDFRYVTAVDAMQRAPEACPDLQLTVVQNTYDSTLAALLTSLGVSRMGFEAAHTTVSRHNWLTATLAQQAGAPALVPLENVVEQLRMRKDEYELSMLRESARLLSDVAIQVFGEVRRGRTEREVAQAIDRRLLAAGFERPSFDTIVASGPNAALPHAHPGERMLGENELVVLDFGGVYRSYCSDLTRTVVLGTASDRVREVYAAVLEAHDHAIRTVGPGRSRFAIDAAARDVLVSHGLGDAFGHGTGHGLGIDIHEDPKVTRRIGEPSSADAERLDVVDAGMVFTIEPGAYLPGWGGVRIEDDVLVTAHGVEVLTNVTTDLLEL